MALTKVQMADLVAGNWDGEQTPQVEVTPGQKGKAGRIELELAALDKLGQSDEDGKVYLFENRIYGTLADVVKHEGAWRYRCPMFYRAFELDLRSQSLTGVYESANVETQAFKPVAEPWAQSLTIEAIYQHGLSARKDFDSPEDRTMVSFVSGNYPIKGKGCETP